MRLSETMFPPLASRQVAAVICLVRIQDTGSATFMRGWGSCAQVWPSLPLPASRDPVDLALSLGSPE